MSKHIPNQHAVVLFDGVCNFCNGWVKFIIQRDPLGHLHFASLQSDVAKEIMKKQGIAEMNLNSIVLIDGEQHYTESTAILQIVKRLSGPWKGLYGLTLIPRPIRDFVYRKFAKYRYKMFGVEDSCMLPTPEIRERFLEITG